MNIWISGYLGMWCRCVEDVESEVEHASALLTHERDESTLRRLKAALNGARAVVCQWCRSSVLPPAACFATRMGGGGKAGFDCEFHVYGLTPLSRS